MEKHKYVAFFDLDNTIFSVNSGRIMVEHALRDGMMSGRDVLRAYFLSLGYKVGLLSPQTIMKRMARWLKSVDEHIFFNFTRDLFEQKLKETIRGAAREEIEIHRKNQGRTVILSASTPYICGPVRDFLQMDDIVCTELETVDGVLSGKSLGDFCYGDEKAGRISSYCKKHDLRVSDAWYYADSFSDFAALSIVGNPICVSPDEKLQNEAKEKGWEIYYW